MRVLLLILGLFSSTLLWAQNHYAEEGSQAQRKTVPEIVSKMVSLGYHDISEVEWDHDEGKFEAEAKDSEGERVEVEFTDLGEIINIEYE
ncbi:PepSY domain-containing protein [Parasalinivibrio latis]|uniref:PepSY domain-containing protein n=1 Tax=Parasalinivibrio latis TaxID=2952610 RepID=UPI0030E3E9F8